MVKFRLCFFLSDSDSDQVLVLYFDSVSDSDSDQVSVLDFVSVSDSGAHSDQVSILDFCV